MTDVYQPQTQIETNGSGGTRSEVPPSPQTTQAVVPPPKKDVVPEPFDGKILLRKQVIANGEPVMELTFREPTAGDIERIGNPVTVALYENNPKMHFEAQTMTMMMSHLAAVPPSTIRAMHPRDWNNAAWKLAGFFIPDL